MRLPEEQKQTSCPKTVSPLTEASPLSFYKENNAVFVREKEKSSAFIETKKEDIAIIGVSGRYPLANSLESFWENLKNGQNCIIKAPDERWEHSLAQSLFADKWLALSEKHKKRGLYGGFLESINQFDHHLFEVEQEGVLTMPPEMRILLEVIWETFEDAGYSKATLSDFQKKRREESVFLWVQCIVNIPGPFLHSIRLFYFLMRQIGKWSIASHTFLILQVRVFL